ncbi:MAG: cysteine--tRNA ligase [Nanoarchaeota archaeon]|nr:cysteine--tRNA ligase [Nanoarchaeota archaeon]
MSLKLYNTLTRKKEIFKPIKKGHVGIYGCGPTVYWHQHIGNLFRYIFEDLLVKTFEYNNYKVKHVLNVTDVGHLTSDADTGEDKIEKAAKREGKSAQEIANYYLKLFINDFKKLNIKEPDIWCRATKHIEEQISLIKKLEKKGYTYRTSDGIYFDTSKFKDYGKLAKLNIKGLQAGKRINIKEKKNKTDFALWKFSEEPGVRQQEWKSPWGVGFPGWHIECSAMSIKYLGETFDIHTGGEDHIPIHHTNEIAQSEAATGKKFVNYWMHSRWLLFKGEKMSKSKGGIFTLSELEEKGFESLSYRYMALTTHYRKQLNFSLELLEASKIAFQRLKNIISELKDDKKTNKKYLEEFREALNDDLNTPKALQILWKLVRDENAKGKFRTIKEMDKIFGLDLLKKEKVKISSEIKKLVDEREKARSKKEWEKADELRRKINKLGYFIEDTNKGVITRKN